MLAKSTTRLKEGICKGTHPHNRRSGVPTVLLLTLVLERLQTLAELLAGPSATGGRV